MVVGGGIRWVGWPVGSGYGCGRDGAGPHGPGRDVDGRCWEVSGESMLRSKVMSFAPQAQQQTHVLAHSLSVRAKMKGRVPAPQSQVFLPRERKEGVSIGLQAMPL